MTSLLQLDLTLAMLRLWELYALAVVVQKGLWHLCLDQVDTPLFEGCCRQHALLFPAFPCFHPSRVSHDAMRSLRQGD